MEILKGIAVSHGVAAGQAYVLGSVESRLPPTYLASEDLIPAAIERFHTAIANAQKEIGDLKESVQAETDQDIGPIFDAHILILSDNSLLNGVHRRIRKNRMTAEFAVQCTIGEFVKNIRGNPFLQPRINDLQDIERRLLRQLLGRRLEVMHSLDKPVIVIARDLTPSQTATMDRDKVLGFATDFGGTTGHTAIIARAREIPAVVGLESISSDIQSGTPLILDGNRGLLIIDPDEATYKTYERIAADYSKFQAQLLRETSHPAVTADGCRIFVMGNIEFPSETESIMRVGADGIGLFRTEFLYVENHNDLDEETQFAAYKQAVIDAKGLPVVIRTLDLGADKNFNISPENERLVHERNPNLGNRAIRYCLSHPDMFRQQLSAICRASAFGQVKLLIPMVSTREEMIQARNMVATVQERLNYEGFDFDADMPIGAMVEVPSVALTLDQFCDVSDFFSIGTNDLTQYVLAVDRSNERVANLFRSEHPAVLRLLKHTIDIANMNNKPISLCGEMASEPMMVLFLMGIGLRSFSVSPRMVPEVKKIIRLASIREVEKVADTVMEHRSSRGVMNYLRGVMRTLMPRPHA